MSDTSNSAYEMLMVLQRLFRVGEGLAENSGDLKKLARRRFEELAEKGLSDVDPQSAVPAREGPVTMGLGGRREVARPGERAPAVPPEGEPLPIKLKSGRPVCSGAHKG